MNIIKSWRLKAVEEKQYALPFWKANPERLDNKELHPKAPTNGGTDGGDQVDDTPEKTPQNKGGKKEVTRRRPDKWYSKGRPKIKRACAQEVPRQALQITREGTDTEVARRRPDKWHSKGRPKIKWACAQEAPRQALQITREEADTEIARRRPDKWHSEERPKIKSGHAWKELQQEALHTAKAGARRPFKVAPRSKWDRR